MITDAVQSDIPGKATPPICGFILMLLFSLSDSSPDDGGEGRQFIAAVLCNTVAWSTVSPDDRLLSFSSVVSIMGLRVFNLNG